MSSNQKIWTTDNGLKYTCFGIFSLVWWLFCGNFCFSMAVNSVPTLLPLMFRNNGASNALIGIAVGSLPSLLNVLINPIVSTASDRTRTRFGRRRPWLFVSVPLVAFSLVMTGISPDIGHGLARFIPWLTPQYGALIALITAGLVFQLFNLLFDPVFYCVANDVLPASMRGRVVAAMGVAGTLGGYVVNQVFVPMAGHSIIMTFSIIAGVFLVGLGGLCLGIREGEYPPPPPKNEGISIFRNIITYFRECFGFSIYRWLFLTMALNVASQTCRSMYYLIFATEKLEVSLTQYGTVMGTCSLLAAILFIPAGYIVDKWHPVPVFLAGCLLIAFANLLGFFIVRDFKTFAVITFLVSITYVLQNASNRPLLMAIFPPLHFGQFCSANALVFSVALIIANAGGGFFIDLLGYRYIFVWDFILTMAGAGAALMMMRHWKKLGGKNYVSPLK